MKAKGREASKDLSRSQDEIELGSHMRMAQQGDAQKYRTLLTRINKLMTEFVHNSFNRLGLANRAATEDVVQEILLAIHAKRSTYDPAQYFLPWMYAIARYKIVDHLRKNGARLRLTIPIEDELESLEAVASHPIADQLDVVALCETLPPKQRDIIKLVKIEGLSVAEVSERTGFSPSDIKISVHRALKALKEKIRESGYEN